MFLSGAWQFGVVVTVLGVSRSYTMSTPVSTGMDNDLWSGIPPQYVTSHPGQLSLLPSVGRGMSTGQSVMMLCGWGVKA